MKFTDCLLSMRHSEYELFLGVFISSVEPHSEASTQGLSVGDEIIEANDIDLSRMSYKDAVHIIKAARSLTLTVRHSHKAETSSVRWVRSLSKAVSVIEVLAVIEVITVIEAKGDNCIYRDEEYTWVDSEGRACTPPPNTSDLNNTLRSSVSKRSGLSLISSQDERKVGDLL